MTSKSVQRHTLRRGRWVYVRRVPKDMAGLVLDVKGKPRSFVQIALRTDSEAEAARKAAAVDLEVEAEWAALKAGHKAEARKHYLAARRLCEARGFPYIPLAELTAEGADLEALVARVLSLSSAGRDATGAAARGATLAAPHPVPEAVVGLVPEALPHLGEIFADVEAATKAERLRFTPDQIKRWKNPKLKAIGAFVALAGDKPLNQYTRDDALAFRDWWLARIEAEGYSINYANKQLQWLGTMTSTWCKLRKVPDPGLFGGLSIRGTNSKTRPAFSREWVQYMLLAPGALDKLDREAADILLVMVNTALGPGEICGVALPDWRLSYNIPHVVIHMEERTLKGPQRARAIPLLGVSLEAARRIVGRGGISTYWLNANGWSANVSAFITRHGLKETPRHTPYSLRHYCETQMKRTGVDYEVRVRIFGHKLKRPDYGDLELEVARDALATFAL